jgi:vacuolar-type H+-ATPase subunit I/STV1
MDWLIFLSQLPTNPSSLRVTVWRKMRAAGALGLQNGIWVFPHTTENEQFLVNLLEMVKSQGAGGQIFKAVPLEKSIEAELIQRFKSDRDQEYAELIECCTEFLAEIDKETKNKKFTFAELEENEDDLQKLVSWMEKITRRDFAHASRKAEAAIILQKCRDAFDSFSQPVYACEGLPEAEHSQ